MGMLQDVDGLLRGSFTQRDQLRLGRIDIPVPTLVRAGWILGGAYGVFMGLYALMRPHNPLWQQLVASSVKVPLLFLLTLAVTFPSLYTMSALSGSPLNVRDLARLVLAAITVNLAVLASFSPVVGFFTLCTDSYPFMVLLNVVCFGVSGVIGLSFLRRALANLFVAREAAASSPPPDAPGSASAAASMPIGEAGPPLAAWPPSEPSIPVGGAQSAMAVPSTARPAGSGPVQSAEGLVATAHPISARPTRDADKRGRSVFRGFMVIYGAVGAQMGWVLRPFIGCPDRPFELFRERQSSFLAATAEAFRLLFE